ncbi:MAG TPA: hypothetical protein VJ879_04550, partial [Desulfobacter sp.]|nr:hypothetical protein [Desulfobacter sp.]
SDKTEDSKFTLTIEQASEAGLCRLCNFAGRRRRENKPCDFHRMLNYLKVPDGMCALTEADIARKKRDMGLGL